MKKLSTKWLLFIANYTGNIQEAAKAAGMHYSYARRMVNDPLIVAEIQKRNIEIVAPGIADRQDRQQFWTDVFNDSKADMKDRLRASELLGKSEKDFVDRVELTGKDGDAVKYENMTDEQLDRKIALMAKENLEQIQ